VTDAMVSTARTGFTPRPDLWSLDPDVLHLNHGSYGAVPRRSQVELQRLREETERNPLSWFRSVGDKLAHSRGVLASYLEVDPGGFTLVPNASAGVTVALATVPLPAGSRIVLTDHVYGAVRYTADRFAARSGAEVVTAGVPLEADDDAVVDAIAAVVDDRTAVIVVDQITSPTAKVFPVERLIELARAAGVPIVVDGAHAPALIDAPAAGDPDFWTGNFHKWPCAPRGTAGLQVAERWRDQTLPLIASWSEHEPYLDRFDQQGTLDYTGWLAAPTSLEVLGDLDWPAVRVAASDLLDSAAQLLAEAMGGSVPQVGRPAPTMRLVTLPDRIHGDRDALDVLKNRASRELRAEIALTDFDGRAFLRLSAHAYNTWSDYERLATALPPFL
jgi:isopenicillin-N epimerase